MILLSTNPATQVRIGLYVIILTWSTVPSCSVAERTYVQAGSNLYCLGPPLGLQPEKEWAYLIHSYRVNTGHSTYRAYIWFIAIHIVAFVYVYVQTKMS